MPKLGNRDYKRPAKYKYKLVVEISTDYKWQEAEILYWVERAVVMYFDRMGPRNIKGVIVKNFNRVAFSMRKKILSSVRSSYYGKD